MQDVQLLHPAKLLQTPKLLSNWLCDVGLSNNRDNFVAYFPIALFCKVDQAMGLNDSKGGSGQQVRMTHWWVWLSPGLLAVAVAAMVSVWLPPAPSVLDDFGHLLIAETLLHGRVCNPTPPSAESLQTFHQLIYPTYAAKFPIGTGAVLALGYLVFGKYCAGLWLSAGFACSAITWMLLGHFKRHISLLFGILAASHPYLQIFWSQNFTNGWLAVGAMSLIVGGLLRIRRRMVWKGQVDEMAWRPALMIAIGVVVGIFSRPYETVVITCILAGPLLARIIADCWYRVPKWWQHALPGLLVLISGLSLQVYINHCVTDSWKKLPYQLHEEQYGVAPLFIWQQPNEPILGHRFLEQSKFHYGWSMDMYKTASGWNGYLNVLSKRLEQTYLHWGAFLACAPLAVVIFPRERRIFAVYLLAGVAGLYLINFVPWVNTHYMACLLPIAILLAALCARGVMQWVMRSLNLRNSHDRIAALALGSMVACQSIWLYQVTSGLAQDQQLPCNAWAIQRQEVVRELEAISGNHLVIVRYHPNHNAHQEWVFNSCDPIQSKIVWARWSEELNPHLIRDYPNRRIWILEIESMNSENQSQETHPAMGKSRVVLSPWKE
jgi:hypothetical protein